MKKLIVAHSFAIYVDTLKTDAGKGKGVPIFGSVLLLGVYCGRSLFQKM